MAHPERNDIIGVESATVVMYSKHKPVRLVPQLDLDGACSGMLNRICYGFLEDAQQIFSVEGLSLRGMPVICT